MSRRIAPANEQAKDEKRIDDMEAALEESEEQREENRVEEEAEANQKQPSTDWTKRN